MDKNANFMKIAAILVFYAVLVGAVFAQEGRFGGGTLARNYFYVDAVYGNDNNEGLTPAAAFATIQKAIETAVDGDMVLVYPGLYQEEINFLGKELIVQGVALGNAGIPVINNPGDFAVSFYSGEGSDSILRNFVIRDSFMAVFIAGSFPTISNLTIVDNTYGIEAYNIYGFEPYGGSEPDISNCIFWNNTGGDLFGCQVRYSCIGEDAKGEGNITADPLFVDPNAGDYHLFSARGRYWPEHNVWILDRVSSLCIDGGDPSADPLDEPVPNGSRINIGAYGGTVQASMSPDLLIGQAFNPYPANGAVGVDRDAKLRWDPGLDADLHDVYFGTEYPLPLVSSQHMTQFDPGRMDRDTVYYWRIDEIDSQGNITVGAVWKFTTSSVSVPPPKGRTCFVAETGVWVDGTLVSISNVAARRSVGRIDGAAIKNSSMPYLGKVEELQEHAGIFECHDVLLQSGNRIGVAENHYFLTGSGDWVAVQNLKTGMKLQTPKGSIGIVSVTKRPAPYVGKVYNLKVEGSDRYLVGKDAVIVRDY
jgi:hypothetical protein